MKKTFKIYFLLVIVGLPVAIIGTTISCGTSGTATTTTIGASTTTTTTTVVAGSTTTTSQVSTTVAVTTSTSLDTSASTTTTTTTTSTTDTTLDELARLDAVWRAMTFSSLESFPIDLEEYVNNIDLETAQSEVRAGRSGLLIPMIHLGTGHPEGNWKWYLYPHMINHPVYAPAEVLVYKSNFANDAYIVGNITAEATDGEVIYTDTRLTFWFDEYVGFEFVHFSVLKSLVDEVLASTEAYLVIPAGQKIGYTHSGSALDIKAFNLTLNNGLSEVTPEGWFVTSSYFNPINFFTEEIQDEILNFYNTYVYPSMVEGGKWIESSLTADFDISIEDTIWGNWWYKSGPMTPDYSGYYFREGIVVFLHKDKTNPETFVKVPGDGDDLVTAECPSWQGVYIDSGQLVGLRNSNGRYIEIISGSASDEGVMALKLFHQATNESQTRYARFVYTASEINKFYDELQFKIYDTSAEASADAEFSDPVVYIRDQEKGTPNN